MTFEFVINTVHNTMCYVAPLKFTKCIDRQGNVPHPPAIPLWCHDTKPFLKWKTAVGVNAKAENAPKIMVRKMWHRLQYICGDAALKAQSAEWGEILSQHSILTFCLCYDFYIFHWEEYHIWALRYNRLVDLSRWTCLDVSFTSSCC